MNLRPYQQRAIAELSGRFASGGRAVVVVLPTGSGKTIIASAIIASAIADGGRVLFLVHRDELLRQSVAKLRSAGVSEIRTIRAGRDYGSREARVVIASIPTLARWPAQDLPRASLVIFDEAHHAKARTWAAIAAHYVDSKIVGLTATPQRGDGQSLGDIFDSIVIGATPRELIDLGHLAPSTIWAPPRNLATGSIAIDPVAAWRQHGGAGKFVAFCGTVAAARLVAADFEAAHVRCGVVFGSQAPKERARTLAALDDGEIQGVACVHTLTEGWDSPSVSVCILLRRPVHAGCYLQMCGRVLRPHADKKKAIVIDLCGSSLAHGPLDLNREYTLTGGGIAAVDKKQIRQCPACGHVYVAQKSCPVCAYVAQTTPTTRSLVAGVALAELTEKKEVNILMENLKSRSWQYSEGWAERAAAAIGRMR